jgi:hypothetical protein
MCYLKGNRMEKSGRFFIQERGHSSLIREDSILHKEVINIL